MNICKYVLVWFLRKIYLFQSVMYGDQYDTQIKVTFKKFLTQIDYKKSVPINLSMIRNK